MRPYREAQLRRELAAYDLQPREQRLDFGAERGVDSLLHWRFGAQPGKAGGELDEGADGDGDVAGLFGGGGAEEEEEDAREGLEALEGEEGGRGLVGVRKRGKGERGERVVE